MAHEQDAAARPRVSNGAEFSQDSLVIKCRLGEDMRRMPVLNQDLTYDELLLMLQRVFHGKLSISDDITVKYTDEGGAVVVVVVVYTTADEADAYMFYRCFFLFFLLCVFCFFRSPQKYQTTVLGNG